MLVRQKSPSLRSFALKLALVPMALALAPVALALALVACNEPRGELVFGVTSDFRAGVDLHRLEVTTTVGDVVTKLDAIALGAAPGAQQFPVEIPFLDLPHGRRAAIAIAGYVDTSPTDALVVERLAATTAVSDKKLLYRLHLDSECTVGSGNAPACDAPLTCVRGACADPFLAPEKLEPYRDGWNVASDICKPANAGAPKVFVGKGQSDYLPSEDYEVVQLEPGPQGGHHVWISIRAQNLRQSGTRTEISGTLPELGITVTPLEVIFTMLPDEGGYCKLYGLRFQLDGGGLDVDTLLGQTLEVVATMKDKDGSVGVGKRWLKLDETIFGGEI
ncbi:MAG: hypothetical protein EXR75_04970 [Myxococcales bacterium]|nr:hypothetical protein [Myxococcales bacterium]